MLTPYRWYVPSRLFPPPAADARAEFLARQRLSFDVWLGSLVALGAVLWRRSTSAFRNCEACGPRPNPYHSPNVERTKKDQGVP